MLELKNDQVQIIKTQQGIMKEQTHYYKKLYSKYGEFDENELRNFLGDTTIPQISEEQK